MAMFTNARTILIRAGLVGFAGLLAIGGNAAFAVHEDLEFPAAIHSGTCEEPGYVVLELDNLVRMPDDAPTEGDRAGAPGSQVIHGLPNDTEIELTIDDLFGADHILAVFNAEGDAIIACGPIGAYTFGDGEDLAFGLRGQGDSPYTGIVLVDGDDDDDANDDDDSDGTDIEVYIVNNTPAPTATPEA